MSAVSSSSKVSSMEIDIGDVTPANIEQLKTININTLPVRYSPKFYKDLLASPGTTLFTYDGKYIKFAYVNGFTVGAVCARLEPVENSPGKFKMYIMTINVLAAYRRRGIASKLLKYILAEAVKDSNILEIFLHVQTSNDEAKGFYLAHGFEQQCVVADYYTRVEPTSAFLLRKLNEVQP